MLGRARGAIDRAFPGARAWRAILRLFWRDVLAALFAPDIDSVLARLTGEIEQLEGEIRDGKARRRGVAEPAPGMAADQSRVSDPGSSEEAPRD